MTSDQPLDLRPTEIHPLDCDLRDAYPAPGGTLTRQERRDFHARFRARRDELRAILDDMENTYRGASADRRPAIRQAAHEVVDEAAEFALAAVLILEAGDADRDQSLLSLLDDVTT